MRGGKMIAENSKTTSLKQKAAHESKEIAIVFLYLAILFCAMATYSMLLLEEFHISYFTYGAALLNAFVITKIILIGEAAHLGKNQEVKPLLYSSVYKAFLFGLLVFAIHILEELIKRLVHGKDIVGALHEVRLDDLLARSLVIFCAFIPFFAFRELGRVLGQDKLRALFLQERAASNPDHLSSP
jgi:hypothetical protein